MSPQGEVGPLEKTNLCWVLKMSEKLKWAPSIDPRGSCRSERALSRFERV